MQHLVLLGDSIFDNAAYVPAGSALIQQLREYLPAHWQATLCARDGSVINDVHAQLDRLPEGATHLVISAGGNDLLSEVGVLGKPVRTVGEGLRLLVEVQVRFDRDYERMLQTIERLSLSTVVCTIYHPRFPDPILQREAEAALCLFNDVIIRRAQQFGLPVIELRAVCTAGEDYATPIEPSVSGGAKIAQAIASAILHYEFRSHQTIIM
ncbi:MAG: SGNH/GDSL hydrolase family protein [Isosphaeraceae bacterium]|nr:SGNH/GDSL hydrolase family protein [Isosphaeraceae bacterium]